MVEWQIGKQFSFRFDFNVLANHGKRRRKNHFPIVGKNSFCVPLAFSYRVCQWLWPFLQAYFFRESIFWPLLKGAIFFIYENVAHTPKKLNKACQIKKYITIPGTLFNLQHIFHIFAQFIILSYFYAFKV